MVDKPEIREQIDRILRSDLFRASDAQRRLLNYLGEKSLTSEAGALKEYTVGIEALGKPETYDPRHDSSVRLQAGKLRLKLDEYYRGVGQHDPVLVKFPKGCFKLTFERRVVPPESVPDLGIRLWRRIAITSIVAFAAIAALMSYSAHAWFQLYQETSPAMSAWTPDLMEIWGSIIHDSRTVVICVGAPLFISLSPTGFYRDPRINTWEEAESSGLPAKLKRELHSVVAIPRNNYTGIGEAAGAFLLARLLGTRVPRLLFTNSSLLPWDRLPGQNTIFVGPPKFNLQLREIPAEQQYALEATGIRRLQPKKGEPDFLRDSDENTKLESGVTHALISRLPGLHGDGEILVFGGNYQQATMAAVEYMTMPEHASDLVRRIRLPSGKLPRYYQLVVKAKFQNSFPVAVSYLEHRVLPETEPGARLPRAAVR